MSQLHDDCNTLHAGGVKIEFTRLDVAIVPKGTPSRGIRYDHQFALWTLIFAHQVRKTAPVFTLS